MQRRTTLSQLTDSQLNAAPPVGNISKIPLPTSTSRLSMGPRLSLGPARIVKQNPTTQASNAYSSITNEFEAMNLQSQPSANRMSLSARQSIAPDPRRSSVYGKPNVPMIAKDPRNVRDKSYQIACIKTLVQFLIESNYPQQISPKLLSSPTAKDFQCIFKFLYQQIDPTYVFTKKIEEEIPVILKSLRYPFASDISKSHLAAVGSLHAWPSLLAMLIWMVELIMCSEQMNMQLEESENVGNNPEKLFYDYLRKSYRVFLEGGEDYDEMLSELSANFEKKNALAQRDIEQLNRTIGALQEEIKVLTAKENTVAGLEKEKNVFLSDIEKFKKFIKHLEGKKLKFMEIIQKQKEELDAIDLEIAEYEQQKIELSSQVEAQQISPEDIDRMNSEKDQLCKILEGITQTKEEITRIFWERENSVFKKIEQVEKLVQEYNFTGEKIGVIPEEARNATGIIYEISLNAQGQKVENLLNVDIKRSIQPSLLRLKERFNTMFHSAQEELCNLQEHLDKLSEVAQDKTEELQIIEDKLRRFNAQYCEEKDAIMLENRLSGEEMEKLQSEMARMKADLTSGFLMSQQNVQKTTIEYDQLLRRTSEEKEKVGREIFKILEELINFKTHIENSINDYEQVVKKELQQSKSM